MGAKLLSGAIVNRDIIIAFYGSVTAWAKRGEIAEVIRGFPIMVKVSPGYNVMNIKRTSKLIFCDIAVLASIVVALAGLFALFMPIWAAPLLMTSLPIGMVFAPFPFCITVIGTKVSSTSAALNQAAMYIYRFVTNYTGNINATVLCSTIAATESYIIMLIAITCYLKCLIASFANDLYSIKSAYLVAFLRAVKVGPTSTLKVLAANFASRLWFLKRHTKALERTKSLAFPMWIIQAIADYTFSFFHAPIIPQSPLCTRIKSSEG